MAMGMALLIMHLALAIPFRHGFGLSMAIRALGLSHGIFCERHEDYVGEAGHLYPFCVVCNSLGYAMHECTGAESAHRPSDLFVKVQMHRFKGTELSEASHIGFQSNCQQT